MKRVASTKSPRNTVPAFVQKAYKIVSDTNNHDIIRWSESGESFLILDHQRLARQVLGRWFKHENFNSFIRQLNNYGFHKILDLKQGALRNESEIEHYCFAHVDGHFRRGEPGLLYLIRPGTRASGTWNRNPVHTRTQDGDGDDTTMDLINAGDPQTFSSPSGATDLPVAWGQNSDVPTISQDIAAIKHEQTKQAAELDRLKYAYQLLLQEHMGCRTELREHQETIGHFRDFLTCVFVTRPAKNNQGDTRKSGGAADAVVLRRTIGPTVQGTPGARGDESPGSFEVIEVEAGVSEGNNNVSTYSIEMPVEDAESPTTSVTILDDGHPGNAAANYYDPRTPVGPAYDANPRSHNTTSYLNPNVTLDHSAHYSALLSPNVNDPGYGEEEQARVLMSALDFPTPQTPSPLRASQYTPMNITEASTGNPGTPEGSILFDVNAIIDSEFTPIPIPVHISPRLENHFPAAEGTGHGVNAIGHQIKDSDDLFFLCGDNESLSRTTSPAMSASATTPTTPQKTTMPYFASTTSSPMSGDTSTMSTNIAPPTYDTLPLNIPALSAKPGFNPNMFLGLFSHSAGAGMGSYGSDNWANGVGDDTMNVENGMDMGVCMDVTGDGTGSWVYVGGLGGAEAQFLDKVSPRSPKKVGLGDVLVTPPVARRPLPTRAPTAGVAAGGFLENAPGNPSTSTTSTRQKRKSDEMTGSRETRGK